MSEKGLFYQNQIALIWDFDKTLCPQYMQMPLFEEYGLDERTFWDEVHALPAYYAKAGVKVQVDTCYLGHLLTYVKAGKMPGLTNEKLRELGARLPLYPGLPELFQALATILEEDEFRDGDLHLEHYVVSTGLAEMIKGSKVAPYLDGVWACDFIEAPAPPGVSAKDEPQKSQEISQIAGFLDNTTKTRAIFEINKGVNKLEKITVNDMIPEEERRVPLKNMIYIADGPSDIPSFSVMRKHGGLAYAVYPASSPDHFAQVDKLDKAGRVDAIGPADYSQGSHTYMWLSHQVRKIAERIMRERRQALQSRVAEGPVHLED